MLAFRSPVDQVLRGNDMRFAGNAVTSVDTAWREYLARDQLNYFKRRAGHSTA